MLSIESPLGGSNPSTTAYTLFMKILVTGGNGFIGSNLIKALIKENHEVASLDDLSIGLKEYEVPGCHYHYGDIEHINLMDKDFDLIYHLAALSRIQPSFKNPKETFRVNANGTLDVCEFARKIKAKVIYAGSSSRWHNHLNSPYACAKYMGEEYVKLYKHIYNLEAEIVRFYNVYGPGELVDGDWAALIGIWRFQIKNNQPLVIVGDGEQRRDFTHIEDIVDGLIKIGFGVEKHEDAWELGTGHNYSINEVYEMFKSIFDVDKIIVPDQLGNYRNSERINNDAIQRLGWSPKNRLAEYIRSLK